MRLTTLARALALTVLLIAGRAAAADDPAATVAQLIKPFLILPADSGADWDGLDADKAVRWATPGPTSLNKPSPDGNFFARPGRAAVAGRTVTVVASGARSMVFSVYIRDPAPAMDPDAFAAGLRQAGFTVSTARCPADPRIGRTQRWYRLALAKKKPAFLFAGAVPAGGAGYTLYLGDLPTMTQAEAAIYTDNCSGGGPGGAKVAGGPAAPAARPTTGQAGIVAAIEALLRPPGSPIGLPWAALPGAPAITWPKTAPMKMASPYDDAGADRNPRLLEGQFKTATTEMEAIATGDDRAANHFMLRTGQHLPRGAVFEALERDGYTLTALRCGKVYTETSQAWFRIAGAGKQPAILYRAHHSTGGLLTEDYALWLDNVLPPALPGQSAPVAGRCRG